MESEKTLKTKIIGMLALVILTGCGNAGGSFDQYDNFATSTQSIPSGSLIITSNSNSTTGPGIISVWTPAGQLDRVIYDYSKVTIGYASGLALLNSGQMLAISDTGGGASNDFLDLFSYWTPFANPLNLFSSLSSGAATTYMRQLALVTDSVSGRYFAFASESGLNRVTRLSSVITTSGKDLNFVRDFNFANNGTCVLTTPYGLVPIASTTNLAVIQSSATGRVNIFDYNGNCVASSSVTGFPTGVTQHSSGKLLVTYATTSAIFAHSSTTGAASPVTAIYTSAAQLSTPRAIAADRNGYIYVASDGLDQVLKLYWDGAAASATFLGTIIPTSVFTQNITSITVAP